MKDGYSLYALKMVYGGFGAFVMVNFIFLIPVRSQIDKLNKLCNDTHR